MKQQVVQNQNTQIYVSFIKRKQLNSQLQRDNKLKVNILRINAFGKQILLRQAFYLTQEKLYQQFERYQVFQKTPFLLEQLKKSKKACLVRKKQQIYFGQISDKNMQGIGILICKQENIYEGTFKRNKKQGFGSEIQQNGNLYIGEFNNNKKHGKGIFYFFNLYNSSNSNNSQYYDGEWYNGRPDGNGVYVKQNGDEYKGIFKNGLKHGFGIEKYGNGDHYVGQYVNGQPWGIGEYHWSNSSYYKGGFKQGLRNGHGQWKQNKNQVSNHYEGQYRMDKKQGYGIFYWASGWVYKGNFQNDLREGFGELFEKHKCVYSGNWRQGLRLQENSNAVSLSPLKLKKQINKITYVNIPQIDSIQQNISQIADSKYQLHARPKKTQKNATRQNKAKSLKSYRNKNNEQQKIRIGTAVSRPLIKNNSVRIQNSKC